MEERTVAFCCAMVLALFLISFAGAAALLAGEAALPAMELALAPLV